MKVYFEPDDMCTTLKLEIKKIHEFLLENRVLIISDPENADIIIVPTCSGWKKLCDLSLERLKKYNEIGKRVISIGCVNVTNLSDVKSVHQGIIIPTQKLYEIEKIIPDLKVAYKEIKDQSVFRSKDDYRLFDLRKRFINIAFGCSFNCSYCPHKLGLGPLKSRSIENIINQIDDLVSVSEVKIIVLTGMETAYYGRDIGETYPNILKAVIIAHDNYDIHVAQFNPAGLIKYERELTILFSNPRITDIQIPIQTSSPRVLHLMNRPPIKKEFFSILKNVKKNNPRVILRTDIIVGFPTETIEELEQTLLDVSEVFDEVAIYAIEVRDMSDLKTKNLPEFSHEEIEKRIDKASKYLKSKGILTHGGQQAQEDLILIEKKKQEMRREKGCAI